MTTEPEMEAALPQIDPPAASPDAAPEPPRVAVTPATAGERAPQMLERTRRRGRRRRAPVFTPQEVEAIDYKDVDKLKKLISDRGKIEPRRKTGLTAKDQTKMAREIKRARHMALLPYTADHMRQTSRYRMVTRMAERASRISDPAYAAEETPFASVAEASPPAPVAEPAASPAPEEGSAPA